MFIKLLGFLEHPQQFKPTVQITVRSLSTYIGLSERTYNTEVPVK